MADNTLYYGDNLDILRRHIADGSVDLVYLDPPFKSDRDYNVLFAEKDGSAAAAQIKAFEDTWQWDQPAAAQYQETVEQGGRVADVLLAFRQFLGPNDMLAYLAMMAPRLLELRRVLKATDGRDRGHDSPVSLEGRCRPLDLRVRSSRTRRARPGRNGYGKTHYRTRLSSGSTTGLAASSRGP